MRVFSYILFPIIILIGLIIKKNEKKWCFGSWFGLSYTDNTKYLFLEAVKRKDVRAIWITKSKVPDQRLGVSNPPTPPPPPPSPSPSSPPPNPTSDAHPPVMAMHQHRLTHPPCSSTRRINTCTTRVHTRATTNEHTPACPRLTYSTPSQPCQSHSLGNHTSARGVAAGWCRQGMRGSIPARNVY